MNRKFYRVFVFVSLAMLIDGCDSHLKKTVKSTRDESQHKISTPTANEGNPSNNHSDITFLIQALKTDDINQVNNITNKLLDLSKEESEREKIIDVLYKETQKVCATNDFIGGNSFRQLFVMSNMLAKFQATKSLETLIDCSNHQLSVGGLSGSNYATMEAVVKFNHKAIPVLKMKLNTSRKEIKCRIAQMFTLIGGEEAESILKEALKSETDDEVLNCFTNCIESFKDHK